MEQQEALLAAVTALHGYFIGDASMHDTLERVSQLARGSLGVSDQVGITLVVDGVPGTYVFTDPEIPEVDQAQYETGDGPCLKAYATGETVVISSTASSAEHPAFCEEAAAHGFLSIVSFPLETPSGRIGAMNHYSLQEASFGPAEIEMGKRFAAQAAYLLVNAQAYWEARSLSEGLAEAMKSRATIEQAKGIIMATMGVDEDAAFRVMVEQSSRENRKVRDIAVEIVRQTTRRTT